MKIIKLTFIALLSVAMVYLAGILISLETNPVYWSFSLRAFCSFWVLLFGVLYFMMSSMEARNIK